MTDCEGAGDDTAPEVSKEAAGAVVKEADTEVRGLLVIARDGKVIEDALMTGRISSVGVGDGPIPDVTERVVTIAVLEVRVDTIGLLATGGGVAQTELSGVDADSVCKVDVTAGIPDAASGSDVPTVTVVAELSVDVWDGAVLHKTGLAVGSDGLTTADLTTAVPPVATAVAQVVTAETDWDDMVAASVFNSFSRFSASLFFRFASFLS